MANESVRTAFERYLHKRLKDETWEQLVEERFDQDWIVMRGALNEDTALEEMRGRVQEIEAGYVSNRQRKPTKRSASLDDRRALIISDICANDARTRVDVTRFRSDVLAGRLLTEKTVPEWIGARMAENVPPKEILTLELPPGHQLIEEKTRDTFTLRIEPPLTLDTLWVGKERGDKTYVSPGPFIGRRTQRHILKWVDPKREWMRSTPVIQGSELDRLRILSERLAADYGWAHDTAVKFVLTDAVPLIRFLSASEHIQGFMKRGRGRFRRRIKIEAEAWVTSADVEAAFNDAKREMGVAGKWPLKEKTSRIIEFITGLDDRLTWRKKMDLWNRVGAGPGEKYVNYRAFNRAVTRAMNRLGTIVQGGANPGA